MTTSRSPRTEADPLSEYDEDLVRRTFSNPNSWPVPGLLALVDRLRAEAAAPRSGEHGTVTQCPLEGVHEHTFRGPHGFREWLDEPLRNAGEVMRNGPSKAASLPDELPFSVAPREASEPPST